MPVPAADPLRMVKKIMREIGGYIELDTYHLPLLHEQAVALNCGRNALAYLLKARKIGSLLIPKFICDSVTGVCEREGVPYRFYSVGTDLLPAEPLEPKEEEWVLFVNYYSQFDNATIAEIVKRYQRVIVDQTHSYFQEPIPGVDTIYTCRKYFGVADGAFLYTDAASESSYPVDESFDRMNFLLGRYERTASEFYPEYAANNEYFRTQPIKQMSKLTRNLLHAIDYEKVKAVREENFRQLHEAFAEVNQLKLKSEPGTFMYPLMLEGGGKIRKRLQEKKIYIPTLWPDVFGWCSEEETEYQLARDILPLPIDQRYGREDMDYMIGMIREMI